MRTFLRISRFNYLSSLPHLTYLIEHHGNSPNYIKHPCDFLLLKRMV